MQYVFRYRKTDRYLAVGLSLTTVIILLIALVLDPIAFQTWEDVALGTSLFLMIAATLLFAWATHIWQLTVDDTGLHLKNWRRTRHFRWEEIKGYRVILNNNVSLEFVAPKRRPYTIQYQLDDQPTFIRLLHQRSRDLEVEEFHTEKKRIFSNEEFGSTEEERVYFLQKARKRANSWSLVAITVSVLPIFLPNPSTIELLLPMVSPFVLIAVSILSKGSILIFASAKSPLPNVGTGILFTQLFIMFSAAMKIILLEYAPLAMPTLVIWILYAGILFFVSFRQKPQPKLHGWGLGLFIFVFALPYALGVAIETNSVFDQNPSTQHRVEALSKRSMEKAFVFHDYYVTVNDWQSPTEPMEIELDRALYENCEPGDTLQLNVKPGFWGARWIK